MKWALALIFCISFACLAYRARHTAIAADWIDPVSRIDAQDEALYSHSAIRIAQRGDWLTPMFMGRYGLYKPPLLMWLAAVSVRLLGVTAFALRLPVLLAASLAACLVFAWLATRREALAGVAAVLLLISNRLWTVLSTLCMTDGLLAAAVAGAAYCLFRDARLDRKPAFFGFALCTAAAVMAKSVAGLMPLVILAIFWLLSERGQRPTVKRVAQLTAVILLLASPWFLYHLAVHPRWFLAEHIGVEILTFGISDPVQTSGENQALFYLKRLFLTDPVLCAAALAALPWLLARMRRNRDGAAALLAAWLLATFASVLLWRYRHAPYLLTGIPALAILACGYGPLFRGRGRAFAAVAALAVLFTLKISFPEQPWGLAFRPQNAIRSAPLLADYCRKARPTELVIVQPDDELYASLLPLTKLRYCFLGDAPHREKLDFRYLGIMVSADEFDHLDQWRPVFAARLREWDLYSDEPVATAILARTNQELARIVAVHPHSDFLIPGQLRIALEAAAIPTHYIVVTAPDRVFLLARDVPDYGDRGGCQL